MDVKEYSKLTEEKIIKKIVKSLMSGEGAFWRRPYRYVPYNIVTKKPYRGVNYFLLLMNEYEFPIYLTANQAEEKGWLIKKGEKGHDICYYNKVIVDRKSSSASKMRKHCKAMKRVKKEHIRDKYGDGSDKAMYYLRRYYNVFNIAQTNAFQVDKGLKKRLSTKEKKDESPKFKEADKILTNYMRKEGIRLVHKKQGVAYYSHMEDLINMPYESNMDSASSYWCAFFHEAVHSTGISKRLDRGIEKTTGVHKPNRSYAIEELVAEMGATLLCNVCHILPEQLDNSIAYCKSWAKKIEKNPEIFFKAGGEAQRASLYIQTGQTKRIED